MGVLLRFGAIFIVALKRLFSQRRLAILTALGLTAAVALTLSIPLYADAVYYRTLREALGTTEGEQDPQARPPFAFMFRYIGAWYGAVKWEDIRQVDSYLSGSAGRQLGLPREVMVRFFKTDNMGLFPRRSDGVYDAQHSLSWLSFGTIGDVEKHITVTEGQMPGPPGGSADSPVDALMSEERAAELGLHTGEEYILYGDKAGVNGKSVQIPVRISGLWKANDPKEPFWFYNPTALADVLLVPENTLSSWITPRLKSEVYVALWYMVMNGDQVRAADSLGLLGRIYWVRQQATSMLPNISLDVSPVDQLVKYEQNARLLTILLYAFSVPIIGLILAFIGLVVSLTVGQQRNEIAVLRSRGGTIAQVMGIAALEAIVLGGLAVLLGWPGSEQIAKVIGRTQSFLNFGAKINLNVAMSLQIMRFGVGVAVIALVAQLLPTFGASRHTIITYKQERARSMRRPWWQRAWLDLMLLAPAAYGWYMLKQQGSIVVPGVEGALPNDPFQNPLLFLVPALGIFALTLLVLRIMPLVMRLVVWITSHTKSTGLLMAARHLARTPGFYTAPLVLLICTLSLSAFTASLAQTLDDHLFDQTYYQYGTDMRVDELGESTETSATGGMMGGQSSAAATDTTGTGATPQKDEGPKWLFLPVTEYLKVDGVQAAARVGRYGATTRLGGTTQEGVFMGVDRVEFPQVAFWRSDFASQSLGALMNALAATPEGVLVSRKLMTDYAVNPGDTIRVSVSTYGQNTDIDMKVVGSFDLFPSWYPDEGPLFVGNLEDLFEQVGGQFPYEVWLKTERCDDTGCIAVDYPRLLRDIRGLGVRVIQADTSIPAIINEQRRPERQGLFGLLSVGFVAAALLTVLGFFLYALFSFRRRTIELGILRAMGLSPLQMTSLLAWELAFLILTGLVAGTAFGSLVSYMFIPYLQVGAGAAARVPPYLVEIAWPAIFRIYALFGLLFIIALGVLAALLLRMKIFQAIKLGETA